MTARYHELLLDQNKSGQQNKSQGRKGETGWFADIYVKQLGKNEAYAMWDEFKVATGLSITPGKASVEQQPTIYYQSSIKHSFNNQVVAFVN